MTNVEAMLVALAEIAQGFVTIISIGYVRPKWQFSMCLWVMDSKHGPISRLGSAITEEEDPSYEEYLKTTKNWW
jgi:hypothetical protein